MKNETYLSGFFWGCEIFCNINLNMLKVCTLKPLSPVLPLLHLQNKLSWLSQIDGSRKNMTDVGQPRAETKIIQ